MSGIDSSLMVAEESTWGVPVTATRGIPLVSGGATIAPNQIESKGMQGGRYTLPSNLHAIGNTAIGGSYGFELTDRSLGLLFKHSLGAVSTTGPVSGDYTHTFTPGTLTGKGMTFQEGISDLTASRPFTIAGVKVKSWQLACKTGEIATFGIDIIGKSVSGYRTVADGVTTNASPTVTSATAAFNAGDVGKRITSGTAAIPANSYVGIVNSATSIGLSSSNSTNTPVNATATTSSNTLTMGIALAAPSYTAGITPFSYSSGYVKLAGTSVCARAFTLSGDNNLAERFCIGSSLSDEPLEGGGYRKYTGTVEMEFQTMNEYNKFVAGTEFALEFNLSVPASAHAVTAVYNGYFSGAKPVINNGNFPYVVTWPFTASGTTDANALTLTYVTTDATP